MSKPDWMPPLPKAYDQGISRFGTKQMREYAEQYRKAWLASLKPVAYKVIHQSGETHHFSDVPLHDKLKQIPLYRLDQQ
jgi:hypothetical protein